MSTATETCACGASITCDASDVLALGWRLSDWRREHHHDLDAAEACRERDEARADRDEWRDNATTLRGLLDNQAHNFRAMEQALRDVTVERDEARAEIERLRADDTSGPSWDAVALRSALVAMTVERDDLRAAHERLDRDGRAVAGRCLHYEARAEKAEAAIARVRALCDEADQSSRHINGYGYVLLRPLRAALDGGESA